MKERDGDEPLWKRIAQACGFLAPQPLRPSLALKDGERLVGTKELLESKFQEGVFHILAIICVDPARFDSEESCRRDAEQLMAIKTPFLGVEALKRACALTLFKDEDVGFLDRLEAPGAHLDDQEMARLWREAARARDDLNASFIVTDALGGAVADCLNMIIQSESHRRVRAERGALREKKELAETLFPPQAALSGRGGRAPAL